ncbi:hypothetical protein [Marinobacterium litorale]|uniref:hypothetical protein n=1 Tax=Marinobacterium litorale TaxID=404770 RepID=UPI00040D1C5D|nr:hypothetical protein [Marinobacterium litorale]
MKKYIIECDLEIESSHGISEVGFEGGNVFKLVEGIESKGCPLGLPNTEIEIIASDKPVFKVKVNSFDLTNQESQILYLGKLASYLSFIAAKDEKNGHYGTPYINIKFGTFKARPVEVRSQEIIDNEAILTSFIRVSDSLSIESTRSIRFNHASIELIHHNELLGYYYNGLRAESEKSKFFHWFLIVESLEGSERYSEMFPSGTMFSNEEKESIKELAGSFGNDKKNALLSVLTRTSEFRNKKLLEFLYELEVKEIFNMQGTHPITIDTIKCITSARNKLFHKGTEFPTKILWFNLFPIVTQIVENTIKYQYRLEAANK